MSNLISDLDRSHLKAFPRQRREQIVQKIMDSTPRQKVDVAGSREYDRMVQRLRAEGLCLIDFQPLEAGFTALWYAERKSVFGLLKSGIAALVVWQLRGDEDELTTLSIWHL